MKPCILQKFTDVSEQRICTYIITVLPSYWTDGPAGPRACPNAVEKTKISVRAANSTLLADRPVSSLFTILIVLTGYRNVYFFLYGLFNGTLDGFVCIALNDKIISD